LIDTFTSKNKESISIPSTICTPLILSLLEVKVFVSKTPKDYFLYSNSSPITSPIYTSGKSERPSSSSLFPPHLDLLSPYHHIFEIRSHHPKVVKSSIDQSFEVFDNLLFSPRIPSPILSMAGVGGAGVGGVGAGGASGQENIPIQPPRIFFKVAARYAPLVLPTILHDLPENYLKSPPKFMGEGDLTTTNHKVIFDQFVDILGIEHEDIYMRLLVKTFKGQVRTWFGKLPVDSIPSYNDLETSFLRKWGEKKDHLYYLTKFRALRKKTFESVLDFIPRFNKIYHKISVEVKPSQLAAKVTFAGDCDSNFALLLRERRSTTLAGMQDDAIDIESNMMESVKLKTKFEMGTREPKNFKEHARPSGSGKNSSEEKMDEMENFIKDLSNKISRMEMEKAKPDPNVRNQFRRNPNINPQIQQRQIKNEDQKIQAPFKTENLIQGDEVQYYDELDEDLNNLSDNDIEPHLTKQDYEKSLDLESLFNDDENINNLGDSTYKGLVDSIMAELQHKYDLRKREKSSINTPPKNLLSRIKANEAAVTKPSMKCKFLEQSKLK
jgi:hypothetical protein